MNRTFTTPKGTDLPILNLRGKDYLEVKYRLVWFREEHPGWAIETEFVTNTDRSACARAIVRDETGRIIATSHKAETPNHFPDFLEKAETGAIGRALALIGYGTQFCADELDEGERIVDAPSNMPRVMHASSGSGVNAGGVGLKFAKPNLGDFTINFGKKYMGKRLKDIPQDEIEGYVKWLEGAAAKKNQDLTPEVSLLKSAVDRLYHPEKYEGEAATHHAESGEENADEVVMHA